MQYLLGKANHVAEALSRVKRMKAEEAELVLAIPQVNLQHGLPDRAVSWELTALKVEQERDPVWGVIRGFIKSGSALKEVQMV